jgi:hypothetical protein
MQRNVRWLKGNRKSARFRKIRTVAHRMTRHGRDRTSVAATMALAVIMVMESRTPNQHSNTARFDTDATFIGVDNRCTACILDDLAHFVGKLTPGTKTIKGFHGSRTTSIMSGTIRWKWLDNNGLEHEFDIPGSFYIPDGKCCLLSPQHWAKSQKNKTGERAWKSQMMNAAHSTGKEETNA